MKTVRYRKDIPQHRLYFHEYAPPDKITYKVRQVVDWVNDPETRRRATRSAWPPAPTTTCCASSPSPRQRQGRAALHEPAAHALRLPPAIIHSTERQRYYDALKGASAAMNQIVQEAIENNLASVEKLIDAYENPPAAVPFVRG